MFENKPPGLNPLNKKPKYLTSTHFITIIIILMIFTLGQQIKQKIIKLRAFTYKIHCKIAYFLKKT